MFYETRKYLVKEYMSYKSLFYPKSIAVIGASRKSKTVGNDVVKNLITQGYAGDIYPVNPKASELYGKKVYNSVLDVPSGVDLVVVAVPALYVTSVIKEAAQKGAKAAIVISAGFKEIGNDQLEADLKKVCLENDILLVGPNCLGVINPEIKMNASFATLMPSSGNVAFVSQSGALCTSILDYAKNLGIGFSKFLSIGNKADVDELKLIKYFANDPQTKVIAMYVEQLENAPELIKAVQDITRGENPKPVIILKSGQTKEGAGAVASHTGSLSGGDIAYKALFAQSGTIRADSISQLFDYVQIFSKNDLSDVENIAIITNAGGPGVLTTDEVVKSGLEMAQFSEKTTKDLQEFLPDAANTHNPVDILGDALGDRYSQALEVVAADSSVDALLVLLTPQSMTEIEETANAIIRVQKSSEKPIVASFMGKESVKTGASLMRNAGVVATAFPEPAANSLGVFGNFVKWSKKPSSPILKYSDVDKEKVANIFEKARSIGKKSFPEAEALEIFEAYNFPLLKNAKARSVSEAKKVIEQIGADKKFAMKIISQEILHKSDVGGVALNVTIDNVQDNFENMMAVVSKSKPDANLEGVLLMEMAPKNGIETILGVSKAPGLGTTIMFGLGGIYVEVLKDVNLAFVPLTQDDAQRMISNLQASKVFEGVRGQKPFDKKMMIESIGRLAQLVSDFPEIVELDINPLLVLSEGEGVLVLDARVVIT